MADETAIAVVGMACRFPGAADEHAYWDNVLNDVYAIAPMPAERFDRARYYDPEIGAYGKSYCDLGGLVDEHPFDSTAFRMPPKVVENTDVAHLWALECARATLEDAGYDPFALTGANVGVIVGHARGSERSSNIAFSTAVEQMVQALDDAPTLAALGLDRLADLKAEIVERVHTHYPRRTEDGAVGAMTSALAGLVANSFGLTGRHMVVDAACASSFAALDIGVRALLDNRLDAAIVGGASYSQELSVIMFAQSRALSPNGSFPFDQRADGFISSDGFGLVMLRRLEDALRDGNKIRAIIRGVGGSCDGKGKALWAPRREGQVLAMRRAYAMGQIDPGTVDLIEGHATSTPLGDRTELESLHEVYAEARGGKPMPVGSVKGNIGHCREAAGAAGLVKAILALENATIPPTGNFKNPSDQIPWNELAVEVVTAPRPFETDGVRRVGVNAFGIGGLNYHVVVEEAPSRVTAATPALSESGRKAKRCDIAIVGVGGRFPGADSAPAFFEKLCTGEDLSQDVPADRWDSNVYFAPGDRAPYRTYTKRGAFVTDFEADWRRYRVPPKLVERNDPLQFMLLESTLDAFDDAKIDLTKIDRERVSTTVGTVFGSDYALALALAIRSQELADVTADALGRTGDDALIEEILVALRKRYPSINEDSSGSFSSSTLASRTAKTLDFMGPTYALDAACASSLASMEAACELLRSGVVDIAIHGGGDRAMRVQRYEAYCQFYSLSRSSVPRPFDHRADGFIPGEGAGVCVLKRLEDAERDGDPIRAIVRGIGSSSDGEKKSLYKPSPKGLARAMRRAIAQGDFDPSRVQFVECHGGATPLGDATEVAAVRATYLEGIERDRPVTLGSVKSNVGHTQGAAGVIAMIKTAMALDLETIPPTRGFEAPHPDHDFGDALVVNAHATPWEGARVAAVSSMGLAGVNYHAIVEHPGTAGDEPERKTMHVHTLSDATEDAVLARLGSIDPATWSEHVGQGAVTLGIAATDDADLRRAIGAALKAGLTSATRDFLEKQGVFVTRGRSRGPKLAMLFSGQGSQYAGMMGAFAAALPEVDAIVTRVDEWLDAHRRARLSPVFRDGAPVPFELFAVQALVLTADVMAFEAVRTLGLAPDVVTGHSFGDYAALVAAGAWSLEDALEATSMRARAIERNVVEGSMASVTASLEDVERILATVEGAEVANVNAPDQIVVAGTLDGMAKAATAFAAASFEHVALDVPGPFHSTYMGAAADALAEGLAKIPLAAPSVPYLSSVSQKFESDPETIRASLVAQLTKPVRFVRQVELLLDDGVDAFVECGPRAVLTGLTKRIAGDRAYVTSVDDKNRAGAWSLARVSAMITTLERAAENAGDGSRIDLLSGAEAERLLSEPGFDAFWEKTRPSLITFLESMWATEKRYSQLPTPEAVSEAPAVSSPRAEPAAAAAPRAEAPTAEVEPPAAEPPAAEPLPTPAVASDLPSRDEVKAFLLDAICEQSGYPPDIIEMDADLEADLGIDTVKQAQVLGKVRDRYDLRADEKLSLRDFPTLGHVLEYVDKQLTTQRAEPAPAKPAVAVPMVDLSKKRTQKPAAPKAPTVASAPTNTPPEGAPAKSIPASDGTPSSRPAPAKPAHEDERSAAGTQVPTLDLRQRDLAPAIPIDADAVVGLAKPAFTGLAKPAPVGALDAIGIEIPAPRTTVPANTARPVTVLRFDGTAREIGRQHGEAMRDPILEVLDRYQTFVGREGLALLALPETTKRLYGVFDEDSLDELRGVAEATGVHELVLLAYNLDAALFPSLTSGCTQTVRLARENDGAMLHCINEDSPLLLHLDGVHPRVAQIRRRTDGPMPNRTTVYFSLVGQIAGLNGVTDSGLTVTSTTLLDGPEATALPTGRPHPMLVKQILEGASSIEQAVQMVESAHKAGRWSVLVSDADTDRAHYIEYDDDTIVAREEVGRELTSTNHSRLAPADGGEVPAHSALREKRACELVSEPGPMTVDRAKQLLRDRHDHGRGREVVHATMNTVRRVDNVMSLVVEPGSRRLHVTDRVLPPGSTEDVDFLTVEYGTRRTPSRIERVEDLTESGAGVVELTEVMRRQVVRVVDAPRRSASRTFTPKRLLLVGEGAHVQAIAAAMTARGSDVHVEADATRATRRLDTLGIDTVDAIGIVSTVEAKAAWAVDAATWSTRRARSLFAPFELLRAWAPHRKDGTVFGVTFLGGALGFDNAAQGTGDGGGLLGLLKSVRREFDGLSVQALDASPSESPSQVAEALIAELDAPGGPLEVGLLRGKRLVLKMAERRAEPAASPDRLPATWIVTGGARGVTAKMAIRLAELYQPRLVLLGRHPLPEEATLAQWRALDDAGLDKLKQDILQAMKSEGGFSPIAWKQRCESIDKSLEIDATLRQIAERGSSVVYYAVDIADREALAAVLTKTRVRGPIEGVLHGAGVEVAKPFDKKTDALFERTLGGKVDGLVHLLALTKDDPLTHVVGFSSVSGRFGGHGQTDYAIANEAEARLLSAYRATHDVHVTAIAWAAFSEVGLAARSSAKAFLEKAGQAFMTPAEGANHLVRELWAGLPESEITICERLDALDMDRLLVAESDRPKWLERARRAAASPMIDHLVTADADGATIERTLDATEPFLDQHRMGATPIVPAVVSLELMSELSNLDPGEHWSLADVQIERPLKVDEDGAVTVLARREGDALSIASTVRKQDGVVLEPARVFVRGRRVPSQAPVASLDVAAEGETIVYPYPKSIDRTPGSRMIFHGPVFRCLEGVSAGDGGGVAQLIVPAPTSLVPGSDAGRWQLPAALLDGCLQAVGMLGRILHGVVALPAGFGRVDVSKRVLEAAGERVRLAVRFVEVTDDALVADFEVMSAHGPLVAVRRYRAQVVPTT
ncbi:MAG: C45 family autoproteolytic acyltransferase/hydrolase [Deltaproteobacteria bacterium]